MEPTMSAIKVNQQKERWSETAQQGQMKFNQGDAILFKSTYTKF